MITNLTRKPTPFIKAVSVLFVPDVYGIVNHLAVSALYRKVYSREREITEEKKAEKNSGENNSETEVTFSREKYAV